ncbi:hypothetical protein NM208_g6159 [Fusarium decemcellulare]|uniref:Uncharacterized protein n=1 Tax=Fusarium decemcellulare TaxID=57161 RepID=A0ACC1SE56_9HYPO|nr:hypothetical protein NM208_g6159 [Fusarium decemcellulare]
MACFCNLTDTLNNIICLAWSFGIGQLSPNTAWGYLATVSSFTLGPALPPSSSSPSNRLRHRLRALQNVASRQPTVNNAASHDLASQTSKASGCEDVPQSRPSRGWRPQAEDQTLIADSTSQPCLSTPHSTHRPERRSARRVILQYEEQARGSAGDVKRQRTSGEEVAQIAFGLEIEFGCPGGDEITPKDGKARVSFEREQEALQCDRLYEHLSNSLNRHGLTSSYLMMRLYHDYPECGLSDKQPPMHEVYSLQHRDVRIPGHPEGKPKPRYYKTWGFRYEDSCEAGLSGLDDDLRPVELNTPVFTEAEWLGGFPSLNMALSTIREATGGLIRVGHSYGTHVSMSYTESSNDSDDDLLTPTGVWWSLPGGGA